MSETSGNQNSYVSSNGGKKSLAQEFHGLTIQVAKLSTWVSSIAAISVIFIGFVAWQLRGAMDDLSIAVRGMTEIQRDIHYIQNQQDRLRNRMDDFESRFYIPEKRNQEE